MLESITIFSKGGLVLYQYNASPSLVGPANGPENTTQLVNNVLIKTMLADPSKSTKTYHIAGGMTLLWKVEPEVCIVALYPDILFEGPRQYLKTWCQGLVDNTLEKYKGYYQKATLERQSSSERNFLLARRVRPDPKPFDEIFQVLLNSSKGQDAKGAPAKATTPAPASTQKESKSKAKKGKEKRNWHDGNVKVTDKEMAKLDKSGNNDDEAEKEARQEQAIQEARQSFLPSKDDIKEQEEKLAELEKPPGSDSWSSSVTSLLQQLSGNKILSESDLDAPLAAMEDLLTSKNVARDISQDLCQAVRAKLVGKRLNSLYRVQTAVQQGLESVLENILNYNQVNVLRQVLAKRDGSFLGRLAINSRVKPFVISVMGINGIGKTTTLAKLAYYFQQNDCKPLLVAADTFRSGAVEQLQVHASCLELPLFSQGYAKDPSAVAKAAIQQAVIDGNDVVLIDTAGRMQNNTPLMKALGKLVSENQPDLRLMVCEALVGNDGLDQFQQFSQAAGGVDGLILTKMDTVANKVGAAVTLTHHTKTPIVFCGTGQKYHHLAPLSVPITVRSLLASK